MTLTKAVSSSIDERLAALESTLGLTSTTSSPQISVQVESLLESTDKLLQRYHASQHQKQQEQQSFKTSTNSSTTSNIIPLEQTISECEKLFRSLDSSTPFSSNVTDNASSPLSSGLILMSTPSSNDVYTSAPLIYRKQEILARSEELERALEQLANMRDLLCLSNQNLTRELQRQKSTAGANVNTASASSSLLDHVSNAPILSSPSFTFATEDVNIKRLKDVTTKVVNLSDRTDKISRKCDDLVNVYYKLISAVNEKLVLYEYEGGR